MLLEKNLVLQQRKKEMPRLKQVQLFKHPRRDKMDQGQSVIIVARSAHKGKMLWNSWISNQLDTRRTQRSSNKQGMQSGAHLAWGDEQPGAHAPHFDNTISKGSAVVFALHGTCKIGLHEHMAGNNNIHKGNQWALDSSASHHMTPPLDLLNGVWKFEKPFYITIPTGNFVLVERMGNIDLDENVKLNNVLSVPEFSCNLIFVHKLTCDSIEQWFMMKMVVWCSTKPRRGRLN